jgi:hypothetical protein
MLAEEFPRHLSQGVVLNALTFKFTRQDVHFLSYSRIQCHYVFQWI